MIFLHHLRVHVVVEQAKIIAVLMKLLSILCNDHRCNSGGRFEY